jgi:hypothetical protein
MATEKLDPRAALAKMEAEETAANEAATKLVASNATKKKELLEMLRPTDLADVKEKCLLHGFSVTELRGVLKKRGAGSKSTATPRKSTPRKTSSKNRATQA